MVSCGVRRVLLTLGLAACTSSGVDVDQFPVAVDLTAGPVLIELDSNGDERFVATVDTLSPLTIVDSFRAGGEVATPRREQIDLTLYGTDGSANPVARMRYTTVNVLDIHPCPVDVPDPDNPPPEQECQVGQDGAQRTVNGVLGADLLSKGAVRFDFSASSMQFFPDIAGDDASRGRACDAVFGSPFHGGGTLRVSGAEVSFTGRRIAMGACLAFDASDQIREIERGVDALFLVSSALGTTIISESTYERYSAFVEGTPDLDTLPTQTLHLIDGPVTARAGSINQVALVGEEADDRGPCKEMFANHFMAVNGCRDNNLSGDDCPCSDATFCRTGAVLELSVDDERDDQGALVTEGAGIDVLVIPDSDPLLQELRDELRPGLPEVDGIIGANALAAVSMDVDYPNDRVIARCTDDDLSVCIARPKVLTVDTTDEIFECLKRDPGQLD
jgi:hypothetical protein